MSNRKLMLDDPAAYYMQLGREQERERIIELLEEIIAERQKVEQTTWVQNEISNLNYIITLIKEEK